MTTEDLLEKIKAGEVWFWSDGELESGDNAFTLVCPIIIIQPEDMKRYQSAMDACLRTPVPMILYCPRCWIQHIDEPETEEEFNDRRLEWESSIAAQQLRSEPKEKWTNPSHKRHRCTLCHHEWTPALIPTIGVESL